MDLFQEFEKEFAHRYKEEFGERSRWPGFRHIAKDLLNRKEPIIFEVGCIRNLDGWTTDGQSTRILDWIIDKVGGHAVSFDLNDEHVQIAEFCKNVTVIQEDGMFLHEAVNEELTTSLIFLDGMDCVGPDYLAPRSWLQHIGFLAACWEKLPSNCLIAIDDCIDFKENTQGKHVYVDRFFKDMGINPEHSDYLSVWRKP